MPVRVRAEGARLRALPVRLGRATPLRVAAERVEPSRALAARVRAEGLRAEELRAELRVVAAVRRAPLGVRAEAERERVRVLRALRVSTREDVVLPREETPARVERPALRGVRVRRRPRAAWLRARLAALEVVRLRLTVRERLELGLRAL